jgi:hypothetical protein
MFRDVHEILPLFVIHAIYYPCHVIHALIIQRPCITS